MNEISIYSNRFMHLKVTTRNWGMVLSALRPKQTGCVNMNDDYRSLAKAAVTSAMWVPRRLIIGIGQGGILCSTEGELLPFA
jgi:hypothetical protein